MLQQTAGYKLPARFLRVTHPNLPASHPAPVQTAWRVYIKLTTAYANAPARWFAARKNAHRNALPPAGSMAASQTSSRFAFFPYGHQRIDSRHGHLSFEYSCEPMGQKGKELCRRSTRVVSWFLFLFFVFFLSCAPLHPTVTYASSYTAFQRDYNLHTVKRCAMGGRWRRRPSLRECANKVLRNHKSAEGEGR